MKNGLALRGAYQDKLNLASERVKKDVKVHSTRTSRTVQSAYAFMYGLLPNIEISQVYFISCKVIQRFATLHAPL